MNENIPKQKRKKRHQVSEDEWNCKKAKILREQGAEYEGRKVIDGKITRVVKPKRTMKEITSKCSGKTFK